MFIANPGWVLRKPREFLTELMEEALKQMKTSMPDLQRLEQVKIGLIFFNRQANCKFSFYQMRSSNRVNFSICSQITQALLKLLSTQPALAEMVPSTGYLSRIFSVMGQLESNVVKSPVLIIGELAR